MSNLVRLLSNDFCKSVVELSNSGIIGDKENSIVESDFKKLFAPMLSAQYKESILTRYFTKHGFIVEKASLNEDNELVFTAIDVKGRVVGNVIFKRSATWLK